MRVLAVHNKELSFRLFLHLFLAFSSQEHKLGKVIPIDFVVGVNINLVEEGPHLASTEVVPKD